MIHFTRYMIIVIAILALITVAVMYRTARAPHKKTNTSSSSGVHVKNTATQTKIISTVSASTSSGEGIMVIHETDARSTINLTAGTQFIVNLGKDLSWQLAFSPANLVTPVLGVSLHTGAQGIYVATGTGTVKLVATGSPICTSGSMCPQFREHFEVTLDIRNTAH